MGESKGEVKRIQDVASVANATDTIPDEFIRPEDERPGLTTYNGDLPQVPVIDFSIKDDEKLVAQIYDVSCNWGFFQIVNHEIPNDVISRLKQVGTTFFELPQEEKEVYAKPPGAKSVEGYGTKLQKEVNGIKGWVDHLFHILSPPSAVNYKFWPKNPPSYR